MYPLHYGSIWDYIRVEKLSFNLLFSRQIKIG